MLGISRRRISRPPSNRRSQTRRRAREGFARNFNREQEKLGECLYRMRRVPIQLKLTRVAVGFVMLCGGISCGRSSDSGIVGSSKNINGVTARFTIKMTWTKRIKFVAIYRNESSRTVFFSVVPPSYDARFWLGSSEETGCVMVTQAPIIDLVLKPGQERRIPDELTPGNCFKPGTYEVRFYYNLGLLPADLRERYVRQYGTMRVPWSDQPYQLVMR